MLQMKHHTQANEHRVAPKRSLLTGALLRVGRSSADSTPTAYVVLCGRLTNLQYDTLYGIYTSNGQKDFCTKKANSFTACPPAAKTGWWCSSATFSAEGRSDPPALPAPVAGKSPSQADVTRRQCTSAPAHLHYLWSLSRSTHHSCHMAGLAVGLAAAKSSGPGLC